MRFILEATTLALREGGADGLTVSDVARRAGINDGTLYRFFPTKPALLAAWEEHSMDAIIADVLALGAELHARQAPLAEGVREVTKAAVLRLSELAALYGRPPFESLLSRPEARTERMQRGIDGIAMLVERTDAFRPVDKRAAVEVCVMVTAAMSFARRYRLDNESIAEQVADMVTRYLVRDVP